MSTADFCLEGCGGAAAVWDEGLRSVNQRAVSVGAGKKPSASGRDKRKGDKTREGRRANVVRRFASSFPSRTSFEAEKKSHIIQGHKGESGTNTPSKQSREDQEGARCSEPVQPPLPPLALVPVDAILEPKRASDCFRDLGLVLDTLHAVAAVLDDG